MIRPNKTLANRLADTLAARLPDPPPRAVLLGCVYNMMDRLADEWRDLGAYPLTLAAKAGAADLLDQEVPE